LLRILNVVGARPNFMKIAPLMHAMRQQPDIEPLLVHTGQHYDANLSRVFFDELDIPRPDINLGVGSGDRTSQIEQIMEHFEPVLVREQPDLVLVVGDVNSTIACARIAKRHRVSVAHVEAGLRSFDDTMPEEHNRRETDEIADFLFVTEESGMVNLDREAVPGKRYLVGNVMIDTLVRNLEKARASSMLDDLRLVPGEYLVATFHRPSNVDARETLENLVEIIQQLCARAPLVLPLHPRTRHSLEAHGLSAALDAIPALKLVDPLGYLEFLRLLTDARAVITDSGGIQEETTYLGIPCLTMRENTERPVTITLGSNVLVGSDRTRLLDELDKLMSGNHRKSTIPPLWDGAAAPRIVEILRRELGGSSIERKREA